MKLTLFLVLTFAISFQSNLQDLFRNMADQLVSRVGVLNTGLKFIRNFTLGQGIYPVRLTGYDDAGNETLSMVEYQTPLRKSPCYGGMVQSGGQRIRSGNG